MLECIRITFYSLENVVKNELGTQPYRVRRQLNGNNLASVEYKQEASQNNHDCHAHLF